MTKPVSNRLKELRKQAGLTQEELSQKIGVIRKTVSNWERGFSRINPEYAEQLANYFQVSIGYLLGVSDDKQDSSSDSDLSYWITYKQKH
ncbi:helix-turn-helix domain-containing protein [Streptococcus sp. S784/96/1]|uniref:helix-turn-helix domain-containing protein n=1 Tax=Streptococcus sp. S784/96/1 TaxID=2653499 RepID=UPI001389E732|nr:helix-turn-helix transcriptional regulator [Streptococcus sp. S784/96/1]